MTNGMRIQVSCENPPNAFSSPSAICARLNIAGMCWPVSPVRRFEWKMNEMIDPIDSCCRAKLIAVISSIQR